MPNNKVNGFLEYLQKERNYSPHTIKAYKTDLIQFSRFVKEYGGTGSFNVSSVDKKTVQHFVGSLTEKGLSPKSTGRKLASVKSFFRYLLKQGLVESNPASLVEGPKQPPKLPQVIQKEIMDELLTPLESDDWQIRRDRTILELFYSTGIRLSELTQLDLKDIQFDKKEIKVLGKRRKERIVLFGDKAAMALSLYLIDRMIWSQLLGLYPQLYLRKNLTDNPLFISEKGRRITPREVQLRFKIFFEHVALNLSKAKRKSKSELSKVLSSINATPHLIRHTFATHLLNGGASVQSVGELLGHASLSSTQIYTHLDTKKMKEVFEQAHPHA